MKKTSRRGSRLYKNRKREWAFWVVIAAEINSISLLEAFESIETNIINSPENEPKKRDNSYHVPQMEDYLPSLKSWNKKRKEVLDLLQIFEEKRTNLDEEILKISPSWRIDRMPLIDRNILRLGIAELVFTEHEDTKMLIYGYIELAKFYGERRTRNFINGNLDQIRRNYDFSL